MSQKKRDYIFYNNFDNKCPITIIFGILIRQPMRLYCVDITGRSSVSRQGASNKGGVGKTSYFLAFCVNISKTL